jgi:hypothetical protein
MMAANVGIWVCTAAPLSVRYRPLAGNCEHAVSP